MKKKQYSENEPSSSPRSDPNQNRSVLWIVLIMFISGWMFFLGVVVGRGTAPAMFDYQKIETEIAALSKTFMEKQKTKNDLDSDILTTQAELEYPEELKKKTEDPSKLLLPTPILSPSPTPSPGTTVSTSPSPTQPSASPMTEKPVKPAESPRPVRREPVQGTPPTPIKADSQVVAAKSESGESPPDTIRTVPEGKIRSMYDIKVQQAKESVQEKTVAAVVPERTPVATPKTPPPAAAPKPQPQPPTVAEVRSSAAQPVTVQMPSLLDRKSADAVIENLRAKGISASKSPRMIQGKGVWYTVVIGKYASSADADAVMSRLRQENVDAVKQ